MIIKNIEIERFRAFEHVSFSLGKRITAISGRNATQKTTVLGMMVLSIVFRKFVSDKMKSRAGTRRWSSYAPFNYLKAYAGDGVKSGEAVHLDS